MTSLTHFISYESTIVIISIITVYIVGLSYYIPKTIYSDMEYSWSWETPLCFIWFIWFPLKYIFYTIKGEK
jgi:hypothetical protein